MRIELLCDADECLKGPMLSYYGDVAVKDLQIEYILYQWREAGKETSIVIGNAFTTALERLSESFAKVFDQFTCTIEKTIQNRPKWYNPADSNNYRNNHHMPMLRRPRCRWRPRESRRVLDGMRADTMVTDELYEWS